MTIKYFNVKNGLSTGNILLHASNSSVVASTFTGNIVATNSANLGAVGNLIITGGSANYVLITDGAGNLSWAAQTGGGSGSYSNANVADYLPTYTGNVSANYFIGNGSTLTNITGTNVTGYVPLATAANTAATVTTAAQPNITSVGTLSSLSVSGLITATGTGIKTANIQDSTGTITITTGYGNIAGDVGVYGNLTVGTSGSGNVTASYFIGDGSQLTGISASSSNTAATVTTNAQPNITSTGTLTSLTVSGNASFTGSNVSLGSVSNLHITGGTANYVLATDGAGNLSWAAQTGGGGNTSANVFANIISDTFTGNGVATTYTLSVTPTSINETTINYNGTMLLRDAYSLSGANVIFDNAPANGSYIEVTTLTTSNASQYATTGKAIAMAIVFGF